jgi:hypothetical protein
MCTPLRMEIAKRIKHKQNEMSIMK